MFHFIKQLKYFELDRKATPLPVRLSLSGPLLSISVLFSTYFKAFTQIQSDFKLGSQTPRWYDMKMAGAYKHGEPRLASDVRFPKLSVDTPYHSGCRYQLSLFRADDSSSLPEKFHPALVQLEFLERRLAMNAELRISFALTIASDLDEG